MLSDDELRALADALAAIYTPDPKVANTLDSAEAYLRACADEKPVAWMHIDGRVISAATMDQAYRDGGAMQSSLRDYTIPLYAHPAPAAPHPAVQAGWQLVPVKPTLSMNSAGLSAVNQYGKRLVWETYKAMLAAAPAAPQAEPKREPLSDSDAAYWLRHRQAILDAIRREGFVLMSNACGFWLKRMDRVSEAHGIGGSDAE